MCPRELLDPRNSILRAVYHDCPAMFPLGAFASADWLDVLSDLGLRRKIDATLALQCARKVEAMAAQVPPSHPSLPWCLCCTEGRFLCRSLPCVLPSLLSTTLWVLCDLL